MGAQLSLGAEVGGGNEQRLGSGRGDAVAESTGPPAADLSIGFPSDTVACLAAEVWRRRGEEVAVVKRGAKWFVVEVGA